MQEGTYRSCWLRGVRRRGWRVWYRLLRRCLPWFVAWCFLGGGVGWFDIRQQNRTEQNRGERDFNSYEADGMRISGGKGDDVYSGWERQH